MRVALGRIFGVAFAIGLAVALLYLSRFWIFKWWPRDGLFGWDVLRPQGGLLGTWLRGTDFSPFELIVWAVAAFLLLSAIEAVVQRLRR